MLRQYGRVSYAYESSLRGPLMHKRPCITTCFLSYAHDVNERKTTGKLLLFCNVAKSARIPVVLQCGKKCTYTSSAFRIPHVSGAQESRNDVGVHSVRQVYVSGTSEWKWNEN